MACNISGLDATHYGGRRAKRDDNESVRVGAGEAPGQPGDKRARKPLENALRDPVSRAGTAAADALGELGGRRSVTFPF